MLKTLRKPINLIFTIQAAVVFLVALGILARFWILPLSLLIAIFVWWADLETSTAFFIRSVPLFVAIPFTSYFDNFNLWRIVSGLIFLKWFYKNSSRGVVGTPRKPIAIIKKYPLAFLLIIFLIFSLLSLLVATDLFAGIKRIIYFINLGLVPIVIYDLIKKNPAITKKFLNNLLISGVIVAVVGMVQLVSTYLLPLDAFFNFWDNVQRNFYGYQWADIALQANTWFAYFGNQLSLRVFSTFTDSHSFPLYLLMAAPALLAVFWNQKIKKIILLAVFYLLAILSGTRGIWLAVLAPLLATPFLIHWIKKEEEKKIFKRLGLLVLPFLILFSVALPIMGSNQFGIAKDNEQILANRIRSIIDLEETSNNGRIYIWEKTISSILHHPFLGVGIGNFPVVLGQSTDLAKAGSSAHNLYLHIASEIGVIGLAAALGILWLILKRAWSVFAKENEVFIKVYSAAFVLYSLWVLFYSLTDAVLFDERAFLVFAINSAIILGLYKTKSTVVD